MAGWRGLITDLTRPLPAHLRLAVPDRQTRPPVQGVHGVADLDRTVLVDDLPAAQTQGHVPDHAAGVGVPDDVATPPLRDRHLPDPRLGPQVPRRPVGGPGVLHHADRLRVHAGRVHRLQHQPRAVEAVLRRPRTAPGVVRAELRHREVDHGLDPLRRRRVQTHHGLQPGPVAGRRIRRRLDGGEPARVDVAQVGAHPPVGPLHALHRGAGGVVAHDGVAHAGAGPHVGPDRAEPGGGRRRVTGVVGVEQRVEARLRLRPRDAVGVQPLRGLEGANRPVGVLVEHLGGEVLPPSEFGLDLAHLVEHPLEGLEVGAHTPQAQGGGPQTCGIPRQGGRGAEHDGEDGQGSGGDDLAAGDGGHGTASRGDRSNPARAADGRRLT